MGTDQRKHLRRKLGLAAHVTWPRPMPCVIDDISASGARLTLDDVRSLPDEFDLALNKDVMRKCKVMWRRRTQVGVKFVQSRKTRQTFDVAFAV